MWAASRFRYISSSSLSVHLMLLSGTQANTSLMHGIRVSRNVDTGDEIRGTKPAPPLHNFLVYLTPKNAKFARRDVNEAHLIRHGQQERYHQTSSQKCEARTAENSHRNRYCEHEQNAEIEQVVCRRIGQSRHPPCPQCGCSGSAVALPHPAGRSPRALPIAPDAARHRRSYPA